MREMIEMMFSNNLREALRQAKEKMDADDNERREENKLDTEDLETILDRETTIFAYLPPNKTGHGIQFRYERNQWVSQYTFLVVDSQGQLISETRLIAEEIEDHLERGGGKVRAKLDTTLDDIGPYVGPVTPRTSDSVGPWRLTMETKCSCIEPHLERGYSDKAPPYRCVSCGRHIIFRNDPRGT